MKKQFGEAVHIGMIIRKLTAFCPKCESLFLQEDTTAKELADTEQIKTRIDKDSETIWADFSILQKDGTYFGKLTYRCV